MSDSTTRATAARPGSPCPKCGHQPDTPNHVYGCDRQPAPAVVELEPCRECGADRPLLRLVESVDDGLTAHLTCRVCGVRYEQMVA